MRNLLLFTLLWTFSDNEATGVSNRSCPDAEPTERFLDYFKANNPRGIPGLDLSAGVPVGSTLDLGLASLVPEVLLGLEEARLHSFNVEAHRNQGYLRFSVPRVEVSGTYEIPGLWWTTSGNFTVTLDQLEVPINFDIAVLRDSCLYITDFQTEFSKQNHSVTLTGESSPVLEFLFDDLLLMMLDMMKPDILRWANSLIRFLMTDFLPPDAPSPYVARNDSMLNENCTAQNATDGFREVEIPSAEDQTRALVLLVAAQVPWLVGDPCPLPGVVVNIISIAELHNVSVHHLSWVSRINHLSVSYDGSDVEVKSDLLHNHVYNRHRVRWFPNTLFATWQWTEAQLGLVKTKATVRVGRALEAPPVITRFQVRPVMFNPSGNGASRFMSRMSRRLLDGMRSEFGDQLQGGLYFPLVVRLNEELQKMDLRQRMIDSICLRELDSISWHDAISC